MSLFDSIEHTEIRAKHAHEPHFEFLNLSATPEAEVVRTMLDGWFDKIPPEERGDIYQRFRDTNNRNHFGAFWELYLHELLLQMGFTIHFHPETETERNTTPDFLVVGHDVEFYLEATVAWVSGTEESSLKRSSFVYDLLNQLNSPDYFLLIEPEGEPRTNPPVRRLRERLERWLQSLSYDEICRAEESHDDEAIPTYEWEHEGWKITFTPAPKSEEFRGQPGIRPIGITTTEFKIVTPQKSIRNSIRAKARRYGEVRKPLIVAVNALEDFANESAIFDALFGDQQVTLSREAGGSPTSQMSRETNGAWFGPTGPRNKRISGVLMGIRIYPWDIINKTPILYHHPWANFRLTEQAWPLPQKIIDEQGNIEERAERNVVDFFTNVTL